MKAFLLITSLTFFALNAVKADEKCLYSLQDTANAKITWTAYKTPKKVGVDGSFDNVKFVSNEAEDLKTFLLSSSVEITTADVNSGNKERDAKLVKFFFNQMKRKTITAKVQNVNEKNLLVLLSMNGVKKEISMDYTYDNNLLKLTSNIDILNWSLNKPLASIAKACAALHENKTWSDVSLSVTVPVKHECSQKL